MYTSSPLARFPPAALLSILLLTAMLLTPGAAGAAPRKKSPPEPKSAEAAVADQGSIYILVDQQTMIAQIKIRGIALEVLPLKFLAFMDYRGAAQAAAPDRKVQLPAIFTVQEDPNSVYRKYIAPEELITVEEAEKLEAERAAAAKKAAEEAKARGEEYKAPPAKGEPPAEPEPPSDYRIRLDEGWALDVSTEKPDLSWRGKVVEAFHDGLARLRGENVERPQLLGMTLSADDARRIHRLLRPGLQILVIG
jgi:hypothetical protein